MAGYTKVTRPDGTVVYTNVPTRRQSTSTTSSKPRSSYQQAKPVKDKSDGSGIAQTKPAKLREGAKKMPTSPTPTTIKSTTTTTTVKKGIGEKVGGGTSEAIKKHNEELKKLLEQI